MLNLTVIWDGTLCFEVKTTDCWISLTFQNAGTCKATTFLCFSLGLFLACPTWLICKRFAFVSQNTLEVPLSNYSQSKLLACIKELSTYFLLLIQVIKDGTLCFYSVIKKIISLLIQTFVVYPWILLSNKECVHATGTFPSLDWHNSKLMCSRRWRLCNPCENISCSVFWNTFKMNSMKMLLHSKVFVLHFFKNTAKVTVFITLLSTCRLVSLHLRQIVSLLVTFVHIRIHTHKQEPELQLPCFTSYWGFHSSGKLEWTVSQTHESYNAQED